jgi:mxaJ protein
MFSPFLKAVAVLAASFAAISCSQVSPPAVAERNYITPPKQVKIPASTTSLRVCADPNNMPFSNQKGEGFENKIADLIASEMHVPVENFWWAQRRGFFRKTLRAGNCDVVIGVPANFEMAATTRSYYRSTYVFISREDRHLNIKSFDDPRLKTVKIGVQLIGDDGTNAPPAHALTNRGVIDNIRGYTLYGDYSQGNPPARIIDAVIKGDVDIAVVWGPLAGYFAAKQPVRLSITPVSPEIDTPYLPFVYDIAVGVRRGEDQLRDQVDEILNRKQAAIRAILDSYHVPSPSVSQDAPLLSGKEGA